MAILSILHRQGFKPKPSILSWQTTTPSNLLELSLREFQAMVSFWGGRLEVLSERNNTDEHQAHATSQITTGS